MCSGGFHTAAAAGGKVGGMETAATANFVNRGPEKWKQTMHDERATSIEVDERALEGDNRLRDLLAQRRRTAVIAGIVGLVLALVGLFFDRQRFFAAYLVAYLYCLGLTLGSLAWLMIYHLTGGNWGVAIRRLLEASSRLAPFMALLFLPLLLGLEDLYPWARPEALATDALLQHRQPYLNLSFFLVRAVAYFAIWLGIALLFSRWSRQQDLGDDPLLEDRLRRFGGLSLAVYGVTMTFAAFDWLMSLDAHWFSSMFGVLVAASQALAALAFAIVMLSWLAPHQPFAALLTRQHFSDLGNFLLATVLFWAYISFMQYLIIWSGNLPEEVLWYLERFHGGWGWLAAALLVLGFALPFAALLSGRVKAHRRTLTPVALGVLLLQWINLLWLAVPAVQPAGWAIHWLDLVALVGVGGIWFALYLWQLGSRPLLSSFDLRKVQAQAHGHGHGTPGGTFSSAPPMPPPAGGD